MMLPINIPTAITISPSSSLNASKQIITDIAVNTEDIVDAKNLFDISSNPPIRDEKPQKNKQGNK